MRAAMLAAIIGAATAGAAQSKSLQDSPPEAKAAHPPLTLILQCSGKLSSNKRQPSTKGSSTARDEGPWSAVVEVAGDTARIRPETLPIPIIHRPLVDGWWSLDKVAVTADTISAVLDVNWASQADIIIDRLSGSITIRGNHATAAGTCKKLDPAQHVF
jgi:hypothetical protein